MELWFDLSKIEKMPDTLKGRIIYHGHDTLNRLRLDTVQLKLGWKAPPVKERKKPKEGEPKEKLPNPFSVSVTPSGTVNPEKHIKFAFSSFILFPYDFFHQFGILPVGFLNGLSQMPDLC